MARDKLLKEAKTIFMLGIGGSGMRGLAYILHAGGCNINGADQQYDKIKNEREFSDYRLVSEDQADKLLAGADVLIYSDAVPKDHHLRKQVRDLGIPEMPYHQALGELSRDFTTIAVTGTHGKSSTTSMLAHILIEEKMDPTVIIGAAVKAWGGRNARYGSSDYLVVEADEYREHFLELRPKYAAITSVDFDHPDYFSSLEHVKDAYGKFIKRIDPAGCLVTHEFLCSNFPDIPWPSNIIKVGKEDWQKTEVDIPGSHMRQNAVLATQLAELLGVDRNKALSDLKTWQGIGRRMEELGKFEGMTIVSDYGHHPTEIGATMEAIREEFKKQRIFVVFEAHTLDRLKQFEKEFVMSLSKANGVLLVPVFVPEGRGQESAQAQGILSNVERALKELGVSVWKIDDFNLLADKLREFNDEFDVIVGFSAGILDSHLRDLF